MSLIKVSVIIPIYNGALLVSRCLDSIFNQSGAFDIEVIIVDDGSTDNSIELLNHYNAPLKIIQQSNLGPAAARNEGVKNATGKYLAFLDADDYWHPDFLEKTVLFLENYEVVAVSVGQIHKIPNKQDQIRPQFLESSNNINTNGICLDNFFEFWLIHNHVCTGAVLMQTEIVKLTGGQMSELRITEDLEFWGYLATYGKWGFIPLILFTSDGGEVSANIGWFQKNKKRWESAPHIEQWESRIIKRLPKELIDSFNKVKGKIVKNLAYAMLMSDRVEMARQMTIKYSEVYPKDKIAVLMTKFSNSSFIWFIFARLLFYKEKYRRI